MQEINIWHTFVQNILASSPVEIIAVAFGLASVWFAKKENILVFPTGIVSVILYVWICFQSKLYADAGINAFYFAMSVYGWYNWSRIDENKKQLPVSRNSYKMNLFSIVAIIFFYFAIKYVLEKYTDTDVAGWDALTTSIFIVGMWLMALKKIENWIVWIIGDLISIPLYFYKDLVFSSFQFAIFLIIAVLGFLSWRKTLMLSVEND